MRQGVPQLLVAVVLLGLALSPLALFVGPQGDVVARSPLPAGTAVTGFAALDERRDGYVPAPDHAVDDQVRVVARLEGRRGVPADLADEYGVEPGYTRQGARRLTGTVDIGEVRALSNTPGVAGVRIADRPASAEDDLMSPGVETTGLGALHDQGVTGEGVTVGVVDGGFQVSHRAIADQVGRYRAFSEGTASQHGTAVAAVVADAAPDADLHLAAVGAETTPAEYREAVTWLRESGADVVLDAGSYFGGRPSAEETVRSVAAGAARNVTVVTSAGNYGRSHWADRHRAGPVTFDGAARNPLASGRPFAGQVRAELTWNASADYDLALVRETADGPEVVATSTDDGDGHERLTATVPRGRYSLSVRGPDTVEKPVALELFAGRPLETNTAAGSLTSPGTAPGVVTVGTSVGSGVAAFSSRGPTADGHRGVDLVAPDGVRVAGVETGRGTSYSAPYVAGAVALLRAAYPTLDARAAERLLRESARDVGAAGPDPVAGYGRLDADAAVRRALARPTVRPVGVGPTERAGVTLRSWTARPAAGE
jgi:subtilisin family serine protease